jgi:Flp pilus assembly protein TadB
VSFVVLLILALVWAVFLVPQLIRARAEANPADSIGAFRKQLAVLERTGPRAVGALPAPAAATSRGSPDGASPRPGRGLVRKRRRQILVGLLAAMSVSLVLGLMPGLLPLLLVHVLLDVLCGVYVAQLIRVRNLALEREIKVRYLPSTERSEHEPTLLLSRSAN